MSSKSAGRRAAFLPSPGGRERSSAGAGSPPADSRPCVSSRISPGSNQAAPQVRHRSTSTSPDVIAAIDELLQEGQFTSPSNRSSGSEDMQPFPGSGAIEGGVERGKKDIRAGRSGSEGHRRGQGDRTED